MVLNAPVIAFRSVKRGTLPGRSLSSPILSFLLYLYAGIFVSVYAAILLAIAVSNVRRIVPDTECNPSDCQPTAFAVEVNFLSQALNAPVSSADSLPLAFPEDSFPIDCRCCGTDIIVVPSLRFTCTLSNEDVPRVIAISSYGNHPDESVYCSECMFHHNGYYCHCPQCQGCIPSVRYNPAHVANHYHCDCSSTDLFSDEAADRNDVIDNRYREIINDFTRLNFSGNGPNSS